MCRVQLSVPPSMCFYFIFCTRLLHRTVGEIMVLSLSITISVNFYLKYYNKSHKTSLIYLNSNLLSGCSANKQQQNVIETVPFFVLNVQPQLECNSKQHYGHYTKLEKVAPRFDLIGIYNGKWHSTNAILPQGEFFFWWYIDERGTLARESLLDGNVLVDSY